MLEQLKAYIEERFKEEFTKQGHSLTGAAENSVEFQEVRNKNATRLKVLANYYVVYVDKGVTSYEIKSPYAPPRIKGLTAFFKQKGLSSKEAKSAAYATATKHKQIGYPTEGSKQYSQTGKRTGFTEEMTDQTSIDRMAEIISIEAAASLEATIRNLVRQTNIKLK